MKYLRTIIIVTIFFGIGTISAQSDLSGIVTYESAINQNKVDNYLKNERDSLVRKYKNDKKGEFLIQGLDAMYLNTKPIMSKIVFNNGEGLYKVEQDLNIDNSDIGRGTARISAGGSNEYYYNIKEDKYLIKEFALGESFIFPNPNLEWALTQESKQINGYEVFKATRSEGKVIAWYTPQIPLNFGPKGEYGVPWLILELELGKTIFKATKIELNPKREIKVKVPTKGKVVTLEEYKKIMEKANRKVFGNN
ncbi:GLPGLI family protein [Winogradskyella sp. UBA3174]|uniref:GLPGLI family protein n=1 Tax=Winogradskyella sp. UBA3174 TaxID=1947785 RepID=UPI0025D3AFFF|nr:GLPGLI family protein [Winogradskyella sp. UBA3174]|tara:strand:- start:58153 stop:58905 length:753 start_codon:yes stop_codon:yes gene_type:complete